MEHITAPLGEPLSRELEFEVKSQLMNYWNFQRDLQYRMNIQTYWNFTDDVRRLDEAAPILHPREASRTFNKFTSLYVTPSGQFQNRCRRVIFACIYEQHYHHYNNEPDIEFNRFFAEPILITASGPKTLSGIVRSHKLTCDQASQFLHERQQQSIRLQNSKLLPLYRAIILIMDELHFEDDQEPEGEDGRISLEKHSRTQTVLMVRTGDESHLSAPITFEEINAYTLPLKRIDWIPNGIEVVRVSLNTAVTFVENLQQRENAILPSENRSCAIDTSIFPLAGPMCTRAPLSFEEWVEGELQDVKNHGIENVETVEHALGRAMAGMKGEDIPESLRLEPDPFNNKWKWP